MRWAHGDRFDLIEDALLTRIRDERLQGRYSSVVRIHPALLALVCGDRPVPSNVFGLPIVSDLRCPGLVVG